MIVIVIVLTIAVILLLGYCVGNLLGWYVFGRPRGIPIKYWRNPSAGYRWRREQP